MKTILQMAISLILSFAGVSAQSIQFKHLEVADGLSNNSVLSVLKDSDGYMWFGTISGLNRYDGHSFRIYRHVEGDESSIPSNYVKEIHEISERYLCLRGENGYALLDKDNGVFYNGLSELMDGAPMPDLICIDTSGRFWVVKNWDGLYRYESGKQTGFMALSGRPQLTGIICSGDRLFMVHDNGMLSETDATGLGEVKTDRHIPEQIGQNKYEEFGMFMDSDGCLWIYSVLGVWAYDTIGEKWLPEMTAYFKGNTDFVHIIAQDDKGRIWFGKDHTGIDILDKKTKEMFHVENDENDYRSLSHNTVYSLYADRDGLMWAGTYKKGVSYYDESIFKFDRYPLGDVNCIEEAEEGQLWLGTNEQGILLWDKAKGIVKTYHPEQNKDLAIVSLLKASDGTLWAGTFNNGLYSIKGGNVRAYNSANSSLLSDNVWALSEDDKGRIWIGLLDRGLQRLDPKTGEIKSWTTENSAITDNHVNSMTMTSDGFLLFCTSNGIMKIDVHTEEISLLIQDNGNAQLWGADVNQIYSDSRGLVWLATREGLKVSDLKSNSFENLSLKLGMEPEQIAGITEDKECNIWVASSRKMINIVISQDNEGRFQFNHRIYNNNDGLLDCDFNLRSIKSLGDGQIASGGISGLNIFDPKGIVYNKQKPEVLFSGLVLFDKESREDINRKREITVDYSQNFLTIKLGSDNFILPESNRYLYRLKELGNEWLSLAEGVHSISFINLSYGKYTLQVKAVNSDGVEGDLAELKLTVKPPLWLTWWAYLAYIVIVVAGIIFTVKRWVKKEQEKLRVSRMEQEMRKNEEINNMKFRFFTNISHELRTPLTLIIAPLESMLKDGLMSEQKVRLELMYRNALRLLTMVNQLLDFRRGEMSTHQLSLSEGDIVGYIRNVCNTFLLMADKKQVRLSFFSGMEQFAMAFDSDKVGKIVTNLLSNAFKFTPEGGRVTLMIDLMEGAQDMIEIKVADTGIGISDEEKKHIFDRFYQADHSKVEGVTGSGIGLNLVRDFVQLHEGTVEVFDNIGTGTVFVVQLPVKHVGETKAAEEDVVETVTVDNEERSDFPLLLVVDDNEDFRTFMKISLELQYRVLTVSNGKEALEIAKKKMPDLIISDVMMPVMDGNELCRKIKEDKRTAQIPVILLTAKQATESKVEGLMTGADDYVTKPFNMTILILRIRKLIELSRSRKGEKTSTIDLTPSKVTITTTDEKLIEKAMKYVEDNISRTDLSVEELSREAGMSRVHLYKRLLQLTGKTPIEFIRVIRLKRAAQLLRESKMTVSEIAFEVGFSQPKYFSRYFKEEFGILPSVYQNKEKSK